LIREGGRGEGSERGSGGRGGRGEGGGGVGGGVWAGAVGEDRSWREVERGDGEVRRGTG